MSFPRHREIFPSDGGASPAANAPAHRLDEFPAGYSLAGWSPPEPGRCERIVQPQATGALEGENWVSGIRIELFAGKKESGTTRPNTSAWALRLVLASVSGRSAN